MLDMMALEGTRVGFSLDKYFLAASLVLRILEPPVMKEGGMGHCSPVPFHRRGCACYPGGISMIEIAHERL